MNGDLSKPPRDVHLLVKYMLGLPQDATRQELENEWANQVVPLLNVGPSHLFERESNQLMAAGVPGDKARRIFKQTRRGQQLRNAADREGKIRAQKAAATPEHLLKK
jgi:hypothetical protein